MNDLVPEAAIWQSASARSLSLAGSRWDEEHFLGTLMVHMRRPWTQRVHDADVTEPCRPCGCIKSQDDHARARRWMASLHGYSSFNMSAAPK